MNMGSIIGQDCRVCNMTRSFPSHSDFLEWIIKMVGPSQEAEMIPYRYSQAIDIAEGSTTKSSKNSHHILIWKLLKTYTYCN